MFYYLKESASKIFLNETQMTKIRKLLCKDYLDEANVAFCISGQAHGLESPVK